ncbi:MAG: TetR/AcrR family transcriptional regulator [Pseudomonadales bacterium]|jgi:TetR/AcrR family transcriptional repressor of nem operon
MGHSQAEKARNRERILAAAARQIRENGLESVSVAGLMQAVDLTHGGFYNHFASRDDLLRQALARALDDGAGHAAGTGQDDPVRSFEAFVNGYLSRSHRDHPESGCAVAALACDVGRGRNGLRELMSGRIESMVRTAREALGDEEAALLAVSALVGALTLSRVSTDPARSDAILRAVRRRLRDLV